MNLTLSEINLVINETKRLNEIHAQEMKKAQEVHQKELEELSLKYNRQLRDLTDIHHLVESQRDRLLADHIAYLNAIRHPSITTRFLNFLEVIWAMIYLVYKKLFVVQKHSCARC